MRPEDIDQHNEGGLRQKGAREGAREREEKEMPTE